METPQEKEWRHDPNNWIWGMFYYNPEDRRILPPKRIKWMGWTVNFASPKSILFTVALVVVAVLIGYYFEK